MRLIVSFLMCALLLSGCVSREDADAKLVRGCEAAAKSFPRPDYEIKEVKKTDIRGENGYRKVVLTTLESEGYYEEEQEYTCLFQENFGFLGMGYKAVIERIEFRDTIYGRKDGTVHGGLSEMQRMSANVNQAMRAN